MKYPDNFYGATLIIDGKLESDFIIFDFDDKCIKQYVSPGKLKPFEDKVIEGHEPMTERALIGMSLRKMIKIWEHEAED